MIRSSVPAGIWKRPISRGLWPSFALSDEQICQLIENGRFQEVCRDD